MFVNAAETKDGSLANFVVTNSDGIPLMPAKRDILVGGMILGRKYDNQVKFLAIPLNLVLLHKV